jgi:hypothetical protein
MKSPPLDGPLDDPIDIPFDPEQLPGDVLVRALDTGLPLVLLPVRLATRFHRPRPDAAPT